MSKKKKIYFKKIKLKLKDQQSLSVKATTVRMFGFERATVIRLNTKQIEILVWAVCNV